MKQFAPKRSQGLGMVECLVYCAMLGVLLSQALPGMRDLRQRLHLRGLAENVMTDLMQARSESMRLGEPVQVRFSNYPTGSCYVLHTGDIGACSCNAEGKAICAASGQLLQLNWVPKEQLATVKANVSNMTFSGYRGTVSPAGSIDIAATDRKATIRHVVSLTARVRSCTPDRSISQMKACS